MGKRKIIIGVSASRSIAEISFFIESKGMLATAEKFSDNVHNFFESLADDRKSLWLLPRQKKNGAWIKVRKLLEKVHYCIYRKQRPFAHQRIYFFKIDLVVKLTTIIISIV